jgi:hypothetical protein
MNFVKVLIQLSWVTAVFSNSVIKDKKVGNVLKNYEVTPLPKATLSLRGC